MNFSTSPVWHCAFLVVLFATSGIPAHARIERVVEKSFEAAGTGTLRLQTQGGSIQVMPSSDPVVKIVARQKIRATTEAGADELLERLELTFEQVGGEIRASAKYPSRGPGLHFGSWPPVTVDFIATVPAGFATELRTSGGRIEVGDLMGQVNARTSGGRIKLGRMGAAVDAHTSGGGISLDGAHGPVKLGTSGGNITVGRVEGPADLSTSGGGIRIDEVEGSVRARTSGGSVHVGIVGSLKQDCELSTSGGGIRVAVDKAAAFRLDASTSGGGVETSGLKILSGDGERRRNRLDGDVNGGGPQLKLRSSGGSIAVVAR
jgi:hypothetical protein